VRLRPAPLKRETVLLYGARRSACTTSLRAPGPEFEATRESLRRAGVSQVDPPRGAPEGGLWVRDPTATSSTSGRRPARGRPPIRR